MYARPPSRRAAVRWICLALSAAAVCGAQTAAPPTAVPAYRQADKVAVLTVHGPIDRVTLHSLERRVRQADDDGADAIVLDLDTPGGQLEPTLDICHLIRTEAPANTVAWINPQAFSAGTIIALACREIVVAPDATFGDAAPVSPLGPIPVTERAKVESPLLAEVVHSARRNHYDEKLVQAFVSVGVELWMLRNRDTGELVFVDREEYRRVFGEEPPQELTPVAPPSPQDSVRPWFKDAEPAEQGDPPAATAEQIEQQIELEQNRPSSRPRLTAEGRDEWMPVRQVVSNDRLLVLKPDEAMAYGLAAAEVADEQALRAWFGAGELRRYDQLWSESLVQFLTHPVVMGVLLVVFVICVLIELAAPGFGVFGATGLVALCILIGAPWLTGMAQWWEIGLVVLGIALVGVELFVVPGFGLAGLAGGGCLTVGLVGAFVTHSLATPMGQAELLHGLLALGAAVAAAIVAGWLLFRRLETLPLLSRLVLKTEIGAAAADAGGGGLLEAMAPERPLSEGDVGVAVTDLRPSGRADFGKGLVDVSSVGAYIQRGARVRAVSVGRFVIEVEEVE